MKQSTQSTLAAGVALLSGIALIGTAPGWVLALLVFMVAMGLLPGPTSAKPKAARGALSDLKAGLPVVVKDLGTVYELQIPTGPSPGGDEITQVGPGHLVVRNSTGSETRIPAASIKAVIWERPDREARPEAS